MVGKCSVEKKLLDGFFFFWISGSENKVDLHLGNNGRNHQ